MKKTVYLSIFLFLLASTACENFLEEKQYTDVSYGYLKTKTGMESAVAGVYQVMRWYCGSYNQSSNSTVGGNMEAYYVLSEYGTDFTWEGSDGGNKDPFNKYMSSLNPGQDVINKFWNNNYKGITRANTLTKVWLALFGQFDVMFFLADRKEQSVGQFMDTLISHIAIFDLQHILFRRFVFGNILQQTLIFRIAAFNFQQQFIFLIRFENPGLQLLETCQRPSIKHFQLAFFKTIPQRVKIA